MESRKFGYVRVSAKDQNENRQVETMKEIGIGDWDIFIDKQSGKNFDCENYQLMKRMMRKGDTLYIHSLDRFGRNKEYILNEWRKLNKEIGIDIIVLDMPLLDTTKHKDSIGTFISDLILQVLSWIAEDERERIRKRQREGIDSALANGVKFGRPSIEITPKFIQAYQRWITGEITAVKAMNEAGLKKTSFYKMVEAYKNCTDYIIEALVDERGGDHSLRMVAFSKFLLSNLFIISTLPLLVKDTASTTTAPSCSRVDTPQCSSLWQNKKSPL